MKERRSAAQAEAFAAKPAARASDKPLPAAQTPTPDDGALLRAALEGVRPLDARGPARIFAEPAFRRRVMSEEAEVLAQLYDLVSGNEPFELVESEEYIEGARVGLDRRLVSDLRHGRFTVQAHLDLHGMTRGDAKEALSAFVREAARKGRRSVLVVHGRGLRSPGGEPVLKRAVVGWLSHGSLSGHVLAFATARQVDGGGGAMYVLLRRERRRAPFEVLNRAKRGP